LFLQAHRFPQVLEPCVQKLLPKLNVGFVAETDISEMELWCLPATVVMHPTKIAEALHLARYLLL
jgi:hypothetical protein